MKRLVIHLQPARSSGLDAVETVVRLSHLDASARFTEGEAEEGAPGWVEINFKVADLPRLWAVLRAELQSVPGLAGVAIIICEGAHGWDDYLLLHHFDPQEQLDQLS